MSTSMATALSGLQSNSNAINVIGNDLANLNTTGYKSNEIEFQTLMSPGVNVGAVSNYAQGSVQTTNGATDAAIQGNGFFVVNDPATSQTLYTRDGSFQVNSSGQLTTASGQIVQGWNAANGVVNTNAPVGNITLPLGTTVPATPTTTMNLSLNLDSSVATTAPGAVVTAPVQIYDSLGVTHNLTATFTKTGTNAWSYAVNIPPGDLTSGATAPLTTGTLSFDASGNLTSPTAAADPQAIAISGLADGSVNMTINWNLYNHGGIVPAPTITQYASASSISATNQNGFAAASVSNIALQSGGTVLATYSNGRQVSVGQIAVASVENPSSLAAAGNNNLAATATTSTPVVGVANTGARGQIVAGSLESSTVDIATEFSRLLTFERGYQANSRVITTADQLVQQTVNLIPAA